MGGVFTIASVVDGMVHKSVVAILKKYEMNKLNWIYLIIIYLSRDVWSEIFNKLVHHIIKRKDSLRNINYFERKSLIFILSN